MHANSTEHTNQDGERTIGLRLRPPRPPCPHMNVEMVQATTQLGMHRTRTRTRTRRDVCSSGQPPPRTPFTGELAGTVDDGVALLSGSGTRTATTNQRGWDTAQRYSSAQLART